MKNSPFPGKKAPPMLSSSTYHHEDAFTLVEILVVILIIGVLAAVAVPTFLNQRKLAEDASLKTDLKNTAASYATWKSNPANTNAKFHELANSAVRITVAHPDADYIENSAIKHWNDVIDTPKMVVSPNNFITIHSIDRARPEAGWDRAFDEGEVCLVGTNPRSNYNYKAGSANILNYGAQLYYDSKAGGIKTLDELVNATQNGDTVSCSLYVKKYLEKSAGM